MNPHPILVFTYGSNMCFGRMTGRVPSARRMGVACAPGWALALNKRGMDGSGKGNLMPAGEAGSVPVWGVLYETSYDAVVRELDPHERGYEHVWIATFLGDHGMPRRALSYKALPHFVTNRRPFAWYLDLIRSGARSANLPATYRAQLDRFDGVPDPDPERRSRHWPVEC